MSALRITSGNGLRRRHGGHAVPCHTIELDLDTGERREYLSRLFVCPCGEDMRDGDPALFDANERFLAHANCEELIA
jgi:hypothetical protein